MRRAKPTAPAKPPKISPMEKEILREQKAKAAQKQRDIERGISTFDDFVDESGAPTFNAMAKADLEKDF